MKIKLIRIAYWLITLFILLVGFGFSYVIAEVEDAPGVIFIGGAITLFASALVFGVGELLFDVLSGKRS